MVGFDWKVGRGLALISLAVLAGCQSPAEVETRRDALTSAATWTSSVLVPATPRVHIRVAAAATIRSRVARPLGVTI